MTKLSDKIKTALDESRMLILGAQILLGFQYRSFFEKGFEALPPASQYLKLAALGTLLLAIALIMWPSAYHRIVRKGNDSNDVHEFTTTVMDVALLPFALALTMDLYVVAAKVWGARGGILMAGAIGTVALIFWFGYGFIDRARQHPRRSTQGEYRSSKTQEGKGMEKTPIHTKVEQVLTEVRVVLPGAQALLGFQFATILLEAFDKLPLSSKYIHMISLALMALSVILLMTPAAYHRIVEHGEDTEHFHSVASRLLLASMLTLPIGICGDLFVVVRKVTDDSPLSAVSSFFALAVFYGLWFGFTLYRKHKAA
jgi:Family of unknown function (DUF6328)